MQNRIPVFSDKHKICIICEGNEECDYLERLNSLKLWNDQYEIALDNADGNGNVPARYQDRFQNGTYEVVIYGNPCTMQIIMAHWTEVTLKSSAKKVNAPLIEKFTGVVNYKGRANQREKVMQHITAENYKDMCARVKKMGDADTNPGSSNFNRFMEYLSREDDRWIEEINSRLEESC